MLKEFPPPKASMLSQATGSWFCVAATFVVTAPVLCAVHSTTNDRTGIVHLQTDSTLVDNRTSVTAACDLKPAGSKRYKVPFVRVLFAGPVPHPEWRSIPADAKATVFTPYKKLKVKLNSVPVGSNDGLEMQVKTADFEHMVRCQKARLVYKGIGITLHANNLAEMKRISDELERP
ncbi:MAG: hypothetical protein JO316_18665 [Abitibacteriaceae bacterium]|nr:hypothetical protein [Abditibacteriaceae bacterium]